jgi:quercetin dioxygenase-like cupin family protein
MKIDEIPEVSASGGIFTGTVTRKTLVDEQTGSKDFSIAIVNFPKGIKNVFHSHKCDQVLYILSGKGIVADKKQQVPVTAGAVIFIPAGESHWHGATEDSNFSHISILRPGMSGERK